ncbi:MAG: anhydro-N-acetylmuramic acid kinase [Actinomycetota bacterium]
MRVVGIMSGTSHDGVDVAVADFSIEGDTVILTPFGAAEYPIPAELDNRVARAISGEPLDTLSFCRLDTELGQLYADAAERAISDIAGYADLIVSHGQTIWHWEELGRTRGSLQIGNSAWIAERTGVPVVSDIRVRDIAAGGNGAPLVSIFDTLLAEGRYDEPVALLNLGGIANMTIVGGGRTPVAYDLGPANALIDAAVVVFTAGAERYDEDGQRGSTGTVHDGLLSELLAHDYYGIAPPKTTGKETFGSEYLAETLAGFPDVAVDDVVATLTEHVAVIVATEAEKQGVSRVIASGGGIKNPTLVARITDRLGPVEYLTTAALGVPPDAKEAYMTALIGFLTVNGLGGTIPSCTGAAHPAILGTLTPGSVDRPFPDLSSSARVTRLEIRAEGGEHGSA